MEKSDDTVKTYLIPLLTLAVGFFGAKAIPDANVERQTDVKLVELAIGILTEPPGETSSRSLRAWAVDVLDAHSGRVRLSKSARDDLINETGFGFPITYYESLLNSEKVRTLMEAYELTPSD